MAKKKAKNVQQVMRLDARKFGLAGGIICAAIFFLMTLFLLKWNFPAYKALMLETYGIVGYRVSILGAFIGAIFAFIDGFVIAGLFAWIYNKLL